MSIRRKPINEWGVKEVGLWLDDIDLSEYKELLCVEHKIDGQVLMSLTSDDLRNPPVNMTVLGDIKRIILSANELISNDEAQSKFVAINSRKRNALNKRILELRNGERNGLVSTFDDDEDDDQSFTADYPDEIDPKKLSPLEEEIRNAVISEWFRTAVSVLYCFAVFLFASFILAVVHDRLPDRKNYPPLPDVFLENIPVMPWAFHLCEICASILMCFWLCIITFHKHRLVVIRRSCAIAGTIFLLRCFTMFVTSLSVPGGEYSNCSPSKYGTFYKRAERALEIFKGAGMAVQGVRTCGDYMFSGHTATLTLLNFFVTEYTPRRWHYLHTFCWLLNIFGIFFILAAHEHYSIDVLISFYISSRLFLYYHTLASAVQIRTSDERRRRIWFPLFWFFEYGCPLIVPNEYEWPFTLTNLRKLMFWKSKRKQH